MTALIPPETPKEHIFYLTFGMQYRHEEHPAGDWITPDGYVIILANDEEVARTMAWQLFDSRWAFLYDHLDLSSGRFNPSIHHRGCLAVYNAQGANDDIS